MIGHVLEDVRYLAELAAVLDIDVGLLLEYLSHAALRDLLDCAGKSSSGYGALDAEVRQDADGGGKLGYVITCLIEDWRRLVESLGEVLKCLR